MILADGLKKFISSFAFNITSFAVAGCPGTGSRHLVPGVTGAMIECIEAIHCSTLSATYWTKCPGVIPGMSVLCE